MKELRNPPTKFIIVKVRKDGIALILSNEDGKQVWDSYGENNVKFSWMHEAQLKIASLFEPENKTQLDYIDEVNVVEVSIFFKTEIRNPLNVHKSELVNSIEELKRQLAEKEAELSLIIG